VIWLLLSVVASGQESLPSLADVLPQTPTYATARKRLYSKVYFDHAQTLYCGCPYNTDLEVDQEACGLAALTSSRAAKVEVEHLVPASVVGATRPCWSEAATLGKNRRDYCAKHDPLFAAFVADLHNLAPAVGAINAARGNLGPGLVVGEPRNYGECDFERDGEFDIVEPAASVRGDFARAWLYVSASYNLALSDEQHHLLLAWSQADPPSEWERTREARIAQVQGNHNPFVVVP
jgi:deoxyribonuclease-1